MPCRAADRLKSCVCQAFASRLPQQQGCDLKKTGGLRYERAWNGTEILFRKCWSGSRACIAVPAGLGSWRIDEVAALLGRDARKQDEQINEEGLRGPEFTLPATDGRHLPLRVQKSWYLLSIMLQLTLSRLGRHAVTGVMEGNDSQ